MQTVLYPGSFDPVTCGHMDIIRRAAASFGRVIVAVLHNPDKPSGAFSIEERVALLQRAVSSLPNVEVQTHTGLLVDAARSAGASLVVRGLRTSADLEPELEMARLNRQIGGVETVMLAASPSVVHISASMVRVIGRHGGNLHGLVPEEILGSVAAALRAGF